MILRKPKSIRDELSVSNLNSLVLNIFLWRLHDLNQAEKYQKRAVEIKLKKLGPEYVSVATSYSNLSSIYKDFGDFEQAEVCQQRALAIKLKKLGAEHDSVATSYSHLASIHQGLGDFEQFKKYQQLALVIKLKKL